MFGLGVWGFVGLGASVLKVGNCFLGSLASDLA